MPILKSLFSRRPATAPKPEFTAPLAPDGPMVVIGDVHGMSDHLDELLSKVEKAAPQDTQIVFVGDLVDRGDFSADVLRTVRALCGQGAVCLMGNHERMMLDFLEDPGRNGGRWLRNGGLQTLLSFGVGGVSQSSESDQLGACADRLRTEMGDPLHDWLSALPKQMSNGNIHVVHAAAAPDVPMSLQSAQTLMWGDPDFRQNVRTDGQWIVHGHTIVDAPMIEGGVISVDTGAYATGRLTAVLIDGSEAQFIQT